MKNFGGRDMGWTDDSPNGFLHDNVDYKVLLVFFDILYKRFCSRS